MEGGAGWFAVAGHKPRPAATVSRAPARPTAPGRCPPCCSVRASAEVARDRLEQLGVGDPGAVLEPARERAQLAIERDGAICAREAPLRDVRVQALRGLE